MFSSCSSRSWKRMGMHGSQRLGSTTCSSSSKGINGLFYTQAKCPSQRQRTLCSSPAGRGVRCSHSAPVLLLQGGGTRSHRSVVSISCRSAENSVVLLPPPSPFPTPPAQPGLLLAQAVPRGGSGRPSGAAGVPPLPLPTHGQAVLGNLCLLLERGAWCLKRFQ